MDTDTAISVTPGRPSASRRRQLRLAGAAALALAALGTPHALADTPLPLVAVQQATNAAHSYRETVNITTVGGLTAGKTMMTLIAVRRGHTVQVHMTLVSHTAHGTSTTELVDNGKNTCAKVAGQSQFRCFGKSIVSSVLSSTSPDQLAKSLGASVRLTAAGTGQKLGKRCNVYNITFTMSTLHSRGTIWIEAGANRPVEEDGTVSGSFIKGSAPSTITSQSTWSNWDDPSLTIPTVPGE